MKLFTKKNVLQNSRVEVRADPPAVKTAPFDGTKSTFVDSRSAVREGGLGEFRRREFIRSAFRNVVIPPAVKTAPFDGTKSTCVDSREAVREGGLREFRRREFIRLQPFVLIPAVRLLTAFALFVPVMGCGGKPAPEKSEVVTKEVPADGTADMAKELQSYAAAVDPRDLPFLVNRERAKLMKEQLSKPMDFQTSSLIHLKYGIELVNAGEAEQAVKEFTSLKEDILKIEPSAWQKVKKTVLHWLGVSWLRVAEQQNCCARNTPDSCLLPIKGGGIHTKTEGSEHAIAIFKEILADDPNDVEAKWLLNIASMTLNRYPSGVPTNLLIPPTVFKAEYEMPVFPNVATKVGLELLGRSGGVICDDLDGDGNLDVMITGIGYQDQMRFFHNNGNGTFVERTREAGLIGEEGGLNLIQGDYDNDGFPDVVVLRGGWMGKAGMFPFSLLHNNGNGTFTDVTKKAGLFHIAPTQAACWLDFDNDGKLDLFVAFESGPAGTFPCALYHNNGDGTFTDVAPKAGVDFVGYVKAAVSDDYDNDGYPDLLLSLGGLQGGKTVLYHNNKNGTFTDVAASAHVTEQNHTFGAFFFDYNNDGWPDIFITGYEITTLKEVASAYLGMPTKAERSKLYRNNKDGTFTDVSREANLDRVILAMGLNFGDLDNDGWLDFYAATGNPNLDVVIPNRMFRNDGGKRFQEVTTSGNFGHLQKGHAVAFADMNNDGQQDVFTQMGGAAYGDIAYSALFANPGNKNHWVTLKLEGKQTNRLAIGTRIKVTVTTPHGQRDIYRTVNSGGSFGAAPLRKEIGLGDATAIKEIEIRWPVSHKIQKFSGFQMDQFYHIKEDSDQPELLKMKSFKWPVVKRG